MGVVPLYTAGPPEGATALQIQLVCGLQVQLERKQDRRHQPDF